MNELTIQEEKKQYKERLQRVHVVVGISFSLIMYISVFFGIFGILLPFVEVWEKPSRHYQIADINKINYSAMIDPVLADPDYPTINGVRVYLPGSGNDPALRISADFTKSKIFNPNTGKEVENEGDKSDLAYFLKSMHYGSPFRDFGYYLFGFMSLAGLYLVIGGVMLVIKIKYNKGKNTTGKFSKWHRKLLTWLFPPFFIIILTGAYMNLYYVVSSPMTYISSKGENHLAYILTRPVLFPKSKRIEKKNDIVPMLSMNELIKKAQKINPDITFKQIEIKNWKDSTALVKISGYNPYMPFLNGISNDPSVTLSAVDGSLIEQQRVLDKHWSGLVYDSAYFLHFLYGVDIYTRLFISLIMGVLAAALGFGVLLWLEKKAKKFPIHIPVYLSMGKVSLAAMIGVIPATGLMFALQWILPFDMTDRFLWHKGLFSIAWTATLTWSFYRINSYQAAKEFLILGGILFLISPFIHFYSSGFSPIRMWNENMTSILGVDIGLFIFGVILLFIGFILPKDRQDVQAFWTKTL